MTAKSRVIGVLPLIHLHHHLGPLLLDLAKMEVLTWEVADGMPQWDQHVSDQRKNAYLERRCKLHILSSHIFCMTGCHLPLKSVLCLECILTIKAYNLLFA
jgi:hypothetical protein